MGFVDVTRGVTPGQRNATILTIIVGVSLIVMGYFMRNNAVFGVIEYENAQAGIQVNYPQNWLLDTEGDYIFRIRDTAQTGFKTTIQVSAEPVGADTTERNIIDRVALKRAQTFTDYTTLLVEELVLPSGNEGQAVTYSYVAKETSPFLQSVPSVVTGYDIFIIIRGQTIIITFRSDADLFDMEFARFEQFLNSLEF